MKLFEIHCRSVINPKRTTPYIVVARNIRQAMHWAKQTLDHITKVLEVRELGKVFATIPAFYPEGPEHKDGVMTYPADIDIEVRDVGRRECYLRLTTFTGEKWVTHETGHFYKDDATMQWQRLMGIRALRKKIEHEQQH